MREIPCTSIVDTVRDLCIEANKILPRDLCGRIHDAKQAESHSTAKSILADLEHNLDAARELDIPICQDTGMAVVFAEIGQEVHITGGGFEEAVQEGVRRGYTEGLLRCSIVRDPFDRVNTQDNTPAVLHVRLVPGEQLALTVAPKGFGSENMSAVKMMTPACGREEIIQFVLDTVKNAGSNPCPPMVLGVGVGGDFEYCAYLAKKALCREVSRRHENRFYAQMEEELLRRVNELDIGPQGFGGKTTALAVNIETYPTHIAGLPVAVNVGCHVTRHAKKIL